MKTPSNTYFTTGRFATLCNTTKETLFHYDELGILKPRTVKDNGYRYYTLDQLYTYDLIVLLKESNCSLAEIKYYLKNYDTTYFMDFLQDKRKNLLKQKEHLEKMLSQLDSSLLITQNALETPIGTVSQITLPAEFLLVSLVDSSKKLSDHKVASILHQHFQKCESHGIPRFPYGHIILRETIHSGELHRGYLFNPIPSGSNFDDCIERPAGEYLTINHKGGYETIGYSYQLLFDYLSTQKLHIVGNAYELEMINYLSTREEEEYIIQIILQVASQAF